MKASVAFVLLAFLSATTAKVHLQKRKASEVNSIIRNQFQMIPEYNHDLINCTSSRLVQALATYSNSLSCQETSLKTYYKVTSVSPCLSKIKSYQVVSTVKNKNFALTFIKFISKSTFQYCLAQC